MRATFLFAVLIVAPALATAQAYKCKQPDGKTSFQDHPCEPGAKGSAMTLVDPSPPYDPSVKKVPARTSSAKSDKRLDAQPGPDPFQEQREARKRAAECMNARSNLGVLKEQRPVYRYDNKGERKYIEDAERESAIATAQRRVDESCR